MSNQQATVSVYARPGQSREAAIGFKVTAMRKIVAHTIVTLQLRFGIRALPHLQPYIYTPVKPSEIRQKGLVKGDPAIYGYLNVYVKKD